ncbi:MAG TPA: hypothetical protein ENI62_11660, partial [Gammaproteobacteria bacterium]|nr:hypothetical protein [Gammaproteobacteria bacterium]
MSKALKFLGTILSLAALFPGHTAMAEESADNAISAYEIQPGDQLGISVWKEEDMSQAVIVR